MNNTIKWFYDMFKSPQDSHRVLVACIISIIVSHFEYVSVESEIALSITGEILVILWLMGFLFTFASLWCIFSTTFSPKLYMRIGVVFLWATFGHRLYYGVESMGSTYMIVIFFIMASAWLPFALTGMSFAELHSKIDAWHSNKNKQVTVIHTEFKRENVNNR